LNPGGILIVSRWIPSCTRAGEQPGINSSKASIEAVIHKRHVNTLSRRSKAAAGSLTLRGIGPPCILSFAAAIFFMITTNV